MKKYKSKTFFKNNLKFCNVKNITVLEISKIVKESVT